MVISRRGGRLDTVIETKSIKETKRKREKETRTEIGKGRETHQEKEIQTEINLKTGTEERSN